MELVGGYSKARVFTTFAYAARSRWFSTISVSFAISWVHKQDDVTNERGVEARGGNSIVLGVTDVQHNPGHEDGRSPRRNPVLLVLDCAFGSYTDAFIMANVCTTPFQAYNIVRNEIIKRGWRPRKLTARFVIWTACSTQRKLDTHWEWLNLFRWCLQMIAYIKYIVPVCVQGI